VLTVLLPNESKTDHANVIGLHGLLLVVFTGVKLVGIQGAGAIVKFGIGTGSMQMLLVVSETVQLKLSTNNLIVCVPTVEKL
jgi:hypothetical protein